MCLPTMTKAELNGQIFFVVTKCGGEQITLTENAVSFALSQDAKPLAKVIRPMRAGELSPALDKAIDEFIADKPKDIMK